MTELLDLCDRVLELVGDRAETEVTVSSGRSALTRFANSAIHQNVADDGTWVGLKVVVDGRWATSGTNRTDAEALVRVVDRALAAAPLRPVDPDWPGLAPPQAAPPVDHYDEATAVAAPEERARVVRDFVAAGAGREPLRGAGFCDTSGWRTAFANSAGQRLEGRSTRATVEAIHRTATSDGRGWQTSGRLADLDGSAAGRTAAEKARIGDSNTSDLPPGPYEVVLEPACVADLLDFLVGHGFNAKAHEEGRSFVELGRAQLDPAIDLWDDATDPRAIGRAFDAEGTPKRRLDLVRGGVCQALAHDRRTAKRAGGNAESTGHAGGANSGGVCSNLFLAPGRSPVADLVAAVERGLLVTEFWYTRILDPKTQVVTGLTRNGTFLIENGQVRGGIRNLRFTQSYVEALSPGNVLGVGDDARLFGADAHVPTLHLRSWNFTGGAGG
ncbi:MAG: TldD/PmbA family protein [Actinomycetota bacterium]|nr:TldD/PmbA family protein [Actinomycetota bacterium]